MPSAGIISTLIAQEQALNRHRAQQGHGLWQARPDDFDPEGKMKLNSHRHPAPSTSFWNGAAHYPHDAQVPALWECKPDDIGDDGKIEPGSHRIKGPAIPFVDHPASNMLGVLAGTWSDDPKLGSLVNVFGRSVRSEEPAIPADAFAVLEKQVNMLKEKAEGLGTMMQKLEELIKRV